MRVKASQANAERRTRLRPGRAPSWRAPNAEYRMIDAAHFHFRICSGKGHCAQSELSCKQKSS